MTTTSCHSSGAPPSYEVRKPFVLQFSICSTLTRHHVPGHKYIRPKSIHDAETTEEFSKYYMYLACIQFINSVKTASLRWHSPMLDDISAVRSGLSLLLCPFSFSHTLSLARPLTYPLVRC